MQIKRQTPAKPFNPGWQPQSCLIGAMPPAAMALLMQLPAILEQIWPLSRAHRRQLPADIRDLSAILTSQRSELRFNYWKKPNFISAYLYYFLPWNLVRLCSLLPQLPLSAPPANAVLADAGSGPLTLPLALWLARPEWRQAPVTVLAMDASRQPLELGLKLFAAVANKAGQTPWRLHGVAGPLEALADRQPPDCRPWLVAAANVLNELKPGKYEEAASDRFERLLQTWQPLWQNGAQLLFIEPGTRLGGALIMRMRAAGLAAGLYPLAPCTHFGDCALEKHNGNEESERLPSSWCHFVFSAQDAPAWLKSLSQEARLFKTSLSISLMLLAKSRPETTADALPVRVISQSFLAQMSVARYGCAACGLALLRNSRNAVSGSLCAGQKPSHEKRDAKSGALILEPCPQPPRTPGRQQ